MAKVTPQPKPSGETQAPATPETVPGVETQTPVEPVVNEATPTENLDSIAAHVAENAPTPNESAINHAQEEEKAGRGSNQTGKKRGPYKRPGSGTATETTSPGKMSKEAEEKYKRCYMAGAESIESLVQTATQLMGNEWNWRPPQEIRLPDGRMVKVSERERGQEVWGRAFAYKGWEGPSPMVSMFVFSLGFVASRLAMPETKKKAFGLFQRIKDAVQKRRSERGQNLAQSNSGNNRERENDPLQKTGTKTP